MEETKSQLEPFKQTWLAAGADEIMFKPFVTWGNQGTQFVPQLQSSTWISAKPVLAPSPNRLA
jgi:hypothetical protein